MILFSFTGFRRPIQLFTKSDTVQNSPYPDALFSHLHGCQSSSSLTEHHTPEPKYTGIQPSQSASSLVSEQSEHSRDSSSSSSSFCSTCDGSMSPEATGSLSNVNSPDPNFRAFGSISQNILNQPEEDEAIFKTPEPVLFACVKEAIDDLNGKHSEVNAKLDTASHQGDQASNDVSGNHSNIKAIAPLEKFSSAEDIDLDESKVAADVVHTELKCASSNGDKAKNEINEKQLEKVSSAEKFVSSAEDMDQDEALETDDVIHTELNSVSSSEDKAKDEISGEGKESSDANTVSSTSEEPKDTCSAVNAD